MRRFSSALSTLFLTILLVSCSSGSGGGGGASPFVSGKWTATLFPITGLAAFTPEFDMNLAQTGSTISSDSDNTVDSATCAGTHVDSSIGAITDDQFKLVLTINSEKIALTGALSADGKSIIGSTGRFTASPGGPCLNGESGGFTAAFIPPLAGSFTGTMQGIGVLGEPGVTAMLSEDPSFNVSGSMTVTNDPCFSALATAPDKPGISIGSLSSFEATDGTNVIDFIGHILLGPTGTPEYDANLNVIAGCTEESGVITLDPTTSDAVSAPDASSSKSAVSPINPVLVERLKALMEAGHAHENAQ